VTALGHVGLEANDAVPELAAALADKDKHVRAAAAEALSKVGKAAKGAVPALVKALGDESALVRANAAVALGDLANEGRPAVGALTKLYQKDEDPDVREHAAEALKKIDPKAAKEAGVK
jgi:HEAT repeat protein